MTISTPTIESLLEIIAAQAAQIAGLETRIRELENRLNKNSKNSSKPPSTDGFKKPPATSLREKGSNKSGGQPGHKGTTLKQVTHPNHVIHHSLLSCPGCGEGLSLLPVKQEIVRQVFDMPKPQLEVTEHRSEVKACPHCKKRVAACFPDGVASPDLTYYHVSGRRKSLLDGLTGTIVHDHWKPYFTIHGVKHGLCNQHHLRELKGLIEFEEEAWAVKMDRFLRFALKRRYFYQDRLPDKLLTLLNTIYERIIEEGLMYHESIAPPVDVLRKKTSRIKKKPGHNLLIRFRDFRESVLHFLYDPQVPFTNNQAEQDLRMMKCKQKISGGFRSIQRAREFARIRGFISTMRKQQRNIFEVIQSAFSNQMPRLI